MGRRKVGRKTPWTGALPVSGPKPWRRLAIKIFARRGQARRRSMAVLITDRESRGEVNDCYFAMQQGQHEIAER
jgi:hypothetical protein